MSHDTVERTSVGHVETQDEIYVIAEVNTESYEVIRRRDGQPVGRFRGSPTTMWLLEPLAIDGELLGSIVRLAIIEGIVADMPTD